MKAAQAGLAEVAMGPAASQKAADADVQTFASRMVTDHGQSNSELTQFATTKGITLPTEPAEEHKNVPFIGGDPLRAPAMSRVTL